jgi:hypothetical protein
MRTVRLRNAAIASVVAFVLGVASGAATKAPSTPPPEPAASTSVPSPSEAEATASLSAEPTAEPTINPTPEPTPVAAAPVTVKGRGSQKTKPFDLPGGDFTVVISGTADGNVIASLVPRGDPGRGENLFNEIAKGKYRYETTIYGVDAGSYYLDVLDDNAWTVTFTPLP